MLARKRQDKENEPLRRFRNPQDGSWYVQLTLGDTYVTSDENEILTTILGSCIATCVRDPNIGIGGMNHFLLPDGGGLDRDARCYGVNAMELLINDILKRGGDRHGLEAKIFGGANVVTALSDVGSRNAAFARQFLMDENIAIVGEDIGGTAARRIHYSPRSGRAKRGFVKDTGRQLVERELLASRASAARSEAPDVEFFDD
ncbi:MAG: chemotaxis protein CheD [Rhizomicrobium sp.]